MIEDYLTELDQSIKRDELKAGSVWLLVIWFLVKYLFCVLEIKEVVF